MSINRQQSSESSPRKFNGDRMVRQTYDSIDSIITRIESNVQDKHAELVLDATFWEDLQTALTDVVRKKRVMLTAGGYTDAAAELRRVEDFGIRTAVEDFRADAQSNPSHIHNATAWRAFRCAIRDYADSGALD